MRYQPGRPYCTRLDAYLAPQVTHASRVHLIREDAADRYPWAIWLGHIGNALRWLIRAAN